MKKIMKGALCIAKWKLSFSDRFIAPLALLGARLYIACIFWKSGKSKLPFGSDSTVFLFEEEYLQNWEKNSVDVFGMDLSWTTPQNPELFAKMATVGELTLPVLLAIGLMGRFGAFGLLVMAATIELFVYPGMPQHPLWMLILLILVTQGPGTISLDHLIRKKCLGKDCAIASCAGDDV